MLLLLLTVIATGQVPAPPSVPRPPAVEIAALKARVLAFQDCWYVKRDEACFWSFVTEGSVLRRPEFKASAFSGAFADTPEPSTLSLGIDAISMGTSGPPFFNTPANDKFYVVRAEDYLEADVRDLDPDELRRLRKEGFVPPAAALAVIYGVKGTGGTWMFFGFSAFD